MPLCMVTCHTSAIHHLSFEFVGAASAALCMASEEVSEWEKHSTGPAARGAGTLHPIHDFDLDAYEFPDLCGLHC